MSKALTIQMADASTISRDDEQLASELGRLYDDARSGLRRVVALGLFCHAIKSKLPHGQFQAWLKKYLPEISIASLKEHMRLSEGVLEKCGVKLGAVLKSHPEPQQLLLLPDDQVTSKPTQKLRHDIFAILENVDSKRQLLFEIRNTAPRTSKGRRALNAEEQIESAKKFAASRIESIKFALHDLCDDRTYGAPLFTFANKVDLEILAAKTLPEVATELRGFLRNPKGGAK